MGCDVPHCSTENLLNAYQLMQDKKNVIGPTDDGGYYLLGLQEKNDQLFNFTSWGSENVLDKTQSIASEKGVIFSAIEKLQDIDTYQDLELASSQLYSLKQFLVAE